MDSDTSGAAQRPRHVLHRRVHYSWASELPSLPHSPRPKVMENLRPPGNAVAVQDVPTQPPARLLPLPPSDHSTNGERTAQEERWGHNPPDAIRAKSTVSPADNYPFHPVGQKSDGGRRVEGRRRGCAAVPRDRHVRCSLDGCAETYVGRCPDKASGDQWIVACGPRAHRPSHSILSSVPKTASSSVVTRLATIKERFPTSQSPTPFGRFSTCSHSASVRPSASLVRRIASCFCR